MGTWQVAYENFVRKLLPAFWENCLEWLGGTGVSILKAAIFMFIGWWIASIITRAVGRLMKRTKADQSIRVFICSCIKVVLRIIVIIMAMAALGLNVTSIITALGAAGITLGLAMQDSLSNFASGVLILFNKPFVVGDYIEVEDSGGTVKEVALMCTTLINPENKEVIYPNSKIAASKIINHTALNRRRMDLQFVVAADSDIQRVKTAFQYAIKESAFTITDSTVDPPLIGIREFGYDSITYDIRVWTNTSDFWAAYYDIEEKVLLAFEKHEVRLPRKSVNVSMLDR